ncbi:MAG TPA: hypothetical protein VHM26_15675 [Chitinophagaceae bacterium]|nr:hypothetical protein [Chitinophagaceae bacterium]
MRWPEEYIMACTVAILIFALLTEFFFRMINRFSKESKAFFRWIYIIGLALLILVGIWRAKDVIKVDMTQSPMGVMFGLMVAISGLISLVLMLMKDEK